MIKGIEHVASALKIQFRGVEIQLHGERQDVRPKMQSVDDEIMAS